MKKTKTIIAALMALCMAVSLASCGGTDNAADTSKTETTTTTTAAETEDKTAEAEAEMKGETTTTAATETPEESQAETESTAEDNNAAYAYFDELNAEYESEGDTTCTHLDVDKTANYKHSLFGKSSNMKVWSVDESGNGHILVDYMQIYNESSGAVQMLDSDVYECAGYVYYMTHETGGELNIQLYKVDVQGNVVASNNAISSSSSSGGGYLYNIFVTPDGHIIETEDKTGKCYVITPDLQTKTEITTMPQFKNEHGEMVDCTSIPNTFSMGYKNRAYCYTGNGCASYLDCDTMEWVNFDLDLSEEFANIFDCKQTIGKYAFCNNTIFDMEKLEIVYTFGSYGPEDYYGGDAFIRSKSNEFYRLAPESGERETVKKCDNVTNVTAILDYDRYVVVDDYGVFVHTFEKGDSEETKALSFE